MSVFETDRMTIKRLLVCPNPLEIKDIHVVYMYICVYIHTYLRDHIYIYIHNATDMYCIIRDLLTLHKHIFFFSFFFLKF